MATDSPEALPPSTDDSDETLPAVEGAGETNPDEAAAEASGAQPPLDAADSLPTDPGSQPPVSEAHPAPEPKAAPTPKTGSHRLKFALVGAALLIILSVTGAGILYALTRPQPLISVTSDYQLGSVPAGSTSTTLHVEGRQFSANSSITFLLDGHPAPGSQIVPSDEDGTFEADLTITARWKLGTHQLTARDANGNTTRSSVRVMVVHQGEAHTPGPYGAPADDTARFALYITLVIQQQGSGSSGAIVDYLGGGPQILTVQGQPDPAGGAVCDPKNDDGQPHTTDFLVGFGGFILQPLSSSTNILQKLTTAYTCSGSYQGAKISYTETNTIYKEIYTKGVTCSLSAPRISAQMDGAFNSATTASGTYSVPASTVKCSNGRVETFTAVTGTWTAILFSQAAG